MILNPAQRHKATHFNMVYHFVRECHQLKRLHFEHLSGDCHPADMFIEALPQVTLARHLKEIDFGKVYKVGKAVSERYGVKIAICHWQGVNSIQPSPFLTLKPYITGQG